MKPTREVVVGHDADGKTVFLHDGEAQARHVFKHTPGMELDRLWATGGAPTVGGELNFTAATEFEILPTPGEAHVFAITLPPDSIYADPDFDFAAAAQEQVRANGSFAETFEADEPGMHTTDSIDYVIVVEGPIWLELDDGEKTELQTGDVVVQLGGRHAWRNLTDHQVRIFAVLHGAERNA